MQRYLPVVNIGLLALIAGGVLYVGSQLSAFDERLAALEAAPTTAAPAVVASREHVVRHESALAVRPQALAGALSGASTAHGGEATQAPEVQSAKIDDHLWSEEGRAAIDDVVTAREEQEREQSRQRWQQLNDYRVQKAVQTVTDQLALEADIEAQLESVIGTYMDQRSQRWRRMHDSTADPVEVQKEHEAAREDFESSVVSLVGDDGLDVVKGALERRH
jgi:ribosomal protein S13